MFSSTTSDSASTTSDRQPLLSEAHLDTDFFRRVLDRQLCEWVHIGVWVNTTLFRPSCDGLFAILAILHYYVSKLQVVVHPVFYNIS